MATSGYVPNIHHPDVMRSILEQIVDTGDVVVEFLTQVYSIAPDRLEAVGYGEAQLADPADPASGKNWRVGVRAE